MGKKAAATCTAALAVALSAQGSLGARVSTQRWSSSRGLASGLKAKQQQIDEVKPAPEVKRSKRRVAQKMVMGDAPLSSAGIGVTVPQRSWTREVVESDAQKDAYTYQVTLRKPLGLELSQDPAGVVVHAVWRGGNAEAAGVKPGDRVLATCATLGGQMWQKTTVDGVVSAITSRLIVADDVVVRLERSLAGHRSGAAPRERTFTRAIEVSLPRPVGLVLRQGDQGVYIKEIKPGSSAAQSGVLMEGDRVVAVSSSMGDSLHPTRSVEGVVSAVTTRFGGLVTFQVERTLTEKDLAAETAAAAAAAAAADGAAAAAMAAFAAAAGPAAVAAAAPPAAAAAAAVADTATMAAPAPVAAAAAVAAIALSAAAAAAATQLPVEALAEPLAPTVAPATAADGRSERAVEMIRRFASVGSLDGVERVLEAAAAAGEAPPPRVTNAAMAAALRLNAPAAAVRMFDAAKEAGALLTLPLFTTLVKAQGMLPGGKGLQAAFATVNGLGEVGICADVVIYNALLAACVRAGDLRRAEKLFRTTMWRPQAAAAAAAAAADAGSGQAAAAAAAAASNVQLSDAISWNVLLNGHARARDADAALLLLREMRAAGVSPTRSTYTAVMKALATRGRMSEAAALLAEMRAAAAGPDGNDELAPDAQAFNTVIQGHMRLLDWRAAAATAAAMEAAGVPGDALTLGLLMDGFNKAGLPQEALRRFRDARVAGIAPNLHVYTSAVAAQARRRDAYGALRLVEEMRSSGVKPSQLTFTSAMEACVGGGQPALAESLFDEISRVCGPPDAVAVATLAKARFCGGDAAGARSAFESLETDSDSNSDSSAGAANLGIVEAAGAEQRRRQRPHRGPPRQRQRHAPIAAYHVMIEGLAAGGDFEGAAEYLRRLIECGYTPSAATGRAVAACTIGSQWFKPVAAAAAAAARMGGAQPAAAAAAAAAGTAAGEEERLQFLLSAAELLGPGKLGRPAPSALYLALLQECVAAGRVAEARRLMEANAAGGFGREWRRGEAEAVAALEDSARGWETRAFSQRGLPGSLQERVAKGKGRG